MASVTDFPGLTKADAEFRAQIFRDDGAQVQIIESGGTFTVRVTYPDNWVPPGASPLGTPAAPAPASNPVPPESGPASTVDKTTWRQLIDFYRVDRHTSAQLKVATLAQWALESNRGQSQLAGQHLNFGGIKFRERMAEYARPVDYTGGDGETTVYCKFASVETFVRGYWHFIRSGSYPGWENNKDNAAGYIRHIAPTYAADPAYVDKVLQLFDEAQELLGSTVRPLSSTETTSTLTRLAIVVGHNRVKMGAGAGSPIGQSEFEFNSKVAKIMKDEAGRYNLAADIFFRQPHQNYSDEIREAYARVEGWRPACAIELHFNSVSDPAATGTEMLHRPDSADGRGLAMHLVRETEQLLGLPLRHGNGLKALAWGDRGSASIYALPDVPTVLSEPFFGSSRNDCLRVAAKGEEALALAYLRAVRDWGVARELVA